VESPVILEYLVPIIVEERSRQAEQRLSVSTYEPPSSRPPTLMESMLRRQRRPLCAPSATRFSV
jgi:hypothetical protein